jgi:tetratricopeptide (TPR) repeat protein
LRRRKRYFFSEAGTASLSPLYEWRGSFYVFEKTSILEMLMKSYCRLLNRDGFFGVVLFVFTLLAYRPAWNGQPVWDDDMHMTKPELRSAAGLGRIWTHLGATRQYYPLAHTVFWVEHRLFGDATPGYHLLNILLHVFSALLLVMIVRRLGLSGEAAWLVGGIFALHPVMVESVAWISELKNILSGIFFLAAALIYLRFDSERKKKHYAIALILFVLGLLAKSAIVILPAALLVVFWWKRGRIGWKRDVVPLLPFFAIGIMSGLFTAWVERRYIGAEGSEFNLAFIDRCLIAGRAVWFYLFKLLWPVNLIFIYPRWHIDVAAVWQYLFPAAFLLAAVLFWRLRNRSRTPLAVLLYFVITLFPALGFFNVYPFCFSFVADHFQYLASIGPIAAAAAGIVYGTGLLKKRLRRPLQPLLYVMLLSVLFLLSWQQSGMYSDAETLYKTTIRKNPACWMAHNNLGTLLADMGRTNEAMAHYQKALKLNPNNAEAHNNLGILLGKMGRTNEAMAHYQKALKLNPNFAEAYNDLGLLLMDMGRTDEAMAHYRKALELNPNYAEAHNNLGILFGKMGRADEAMAHFQKALELNPNYAEAHNNLGHLLAEIGRNDEAMVHYLKALELNPNNAEAHYNLGNLLGDMGRTDEAVVHYQKALELNPNYAEAHNNLGILFGKMGRADEAMAHFQKALELNPNYAEAHNNLGILLVQLGRSDEAIAHYRKALEINPNAIDALQNLSFSLMQKGQWTEATSVLQKALASAKSVGDEARAKTIEQILTNLHKAINSSQVNPRAQIPQ